MDVRRPLLNTPRRRLKAVEPEEKPRPAHPPGRTEGRRHPQAQGHRRPPPAPPRQLPGRRARCTPSPPRSATRTPCCPEPLRHQPAPPRADRAPARVINLRGGRPCRRHRRSRELHGLLLCAAGCLAESREARRLVPGSHRCGPRPGPRSRTAGGGDGGCGGSLAGGLGLGNCLRLHGQLGGGTGVGWKRRGAARARAGTEPVGSVGEARGAVCSGLEVKEQVMCV